MNSKCYLLEFMWMIVNKALPQPVFCVPAKNRQQQHQQSQPTLICIFDCEFSNHCPFYDYFLWRIKSHKIKVMSINWQQNPWQPTHTHTHKNCSCLHSFSTDFTALADQKWNCSNDFGSYTKSTLVSVSSSTKCTVRCVYLTRCKINVIQLRVCKQ